MYKITEKIIGNALPAKKKNVSTFLKECLTTHGFMATNLGRITLMVTGKASYAIHGHTESRCNDLQSDPKRL